MTDRPPALPRHARRLLETLTQDGASARETDARPGFLAVSAPKGRVTGILASLPCDAAGPLLARNLAVWRGGKLVATPQGVAFQRRLAAGKDDAGSAFAAQHRELSRETRDAGEAPVLVDATESPLAWLARRKDRDGRPFLDPAAFEAGERFRRDVTSAQLLPSVTSNWSAHGSGGRADPSRLLLPSEVALAARQRIDRALDALGPEFSGLVLDACGFVKRLEIMEAERGWPARSAKVVLRMALAQLARHYGLAASARGPELFTRAAALGRAGLPARDHVGPKSKLRGSGIGTATFPDARTPDQIRGRSGNQR